MALSPPTRNSDPSLAQKERSPGGDVRTAEAFATSWNTVGEGSVYTHDQFVDWFAPIEPASIEGKSVLEMGFGNGSLLYHVGSCRPARLAGVELGDTHETARRNLTHLPEGMLDLHRGDLTAVDLGPFDLVYCIGVLHHLEHPERGFEAVLRHTRPGGRFHCWVYGREGNDVVVHVVDPIRRIASKLPWWLAKYGVALPLAVPYYAYAKSLRFVSQYATVGAAHEILQRMPLEKYSQWIAQRSFPFFHHVAFDQLVTPRTHYISEPTIRGWLERPEIDPSSTYVIQRNGNSWKFGGRRRADA
jgi:SAM-dependent methyltransferase